METRENKQIVAFDPSEIIHFKISETCRNSQSYLNIKNVSESQIAFKIKLSNPKVFQVDESQGLLLPGRSTRIKFFYQYSQDSCKSANKFLVIVSQENCSDIGDVNWNGNVQEFKFWSNFIENEQNSNSESEREKILIKNQQLRDKIEKNRKKLLESKELNYLTHEKVGVFGLTELVVLFIAGFLLGFLYSFYNMI